MATSSWKVEFSNGHVITYSNPPAMPQRIAASLALIAFMLCLLVGALEADNTFTTTVGRALLAMAGTFVVGWTLGAMAQRMIEENLGHEEEKLKKSQAEPPPDGR